MKKIIKPIYANADKNLAPEIASISMSSPFSDSSVFFNFVNTEYPVSHQHNHWEIQVILEGKIRHTLNGCSSVITRGDCSIIRPSDRHKLEFTQKNEQNYQHVNFGFNNETAERLFSLYIPYESFLNDTVPLSFTLKNEELIALMDKLLYIQTLKKSAYESNTLLLINSLAIRYFEQKLNLPSSYPDWLKEFLNYINNPTHLDKSMEQLADFSPYSYSHLSRIFKSYLNISLTEYVMEIKMTYAKRLLRTTELTTLQISSMLFYDSLSTFNHNFKKKFGMTPSEYRRKNVKAKIRL